MAHTKHTNRDGSLDMRFKVNQKAVQARLKAKRSQMKEEALRLAKEAIEPVKVDPVICCVCMDGEATQKGQAKLDCGHTYCISCFTQHARLSNKCPLCREHFAPEPKKEREVIPAFVIADQVHDQLDRMLPSEADAEDVFGFLAVTPSVAYGRLRSLLRNECLSAACSVANWYEPSSDYGFHNTNMEDIVDAANERDEQNVRAHYQAQEAQEALERAAENITVAATGNMESVAMEVDPNPPPGFPARRRLVYPDESESADRRDRVLASDDLSQGISSLAQASWRATELVVSADPDLVSSDSTQGNPEQDFIPLESDFDAMAALAARDDALPNSSSSPPEDGEIVEDDSLVRYFDQAASEAESELADAVAEAAEASAGPWQPPTPPRQRTPEHDAAAREWLQRRAEEVESENAMLQAENARLLADIRVHTSEQGLGEPESNWRPWRRARAARRQQAHEAAEIASERAAARDDGEDSQSHDGILYDPAHDD
jgi:hypothetical protein